MANSSIILALFAVITILKGTEIENFDAYDLAKARGEFENERTTVKYDFVWKVTVTTTTNRTVPNTRDRDLVMDSLQYTMMDFEYRYMWMSLLKQNHSLFMHQLKTEGSAKFIKKKPGDQTYEGESGKRRWKFMLDYFKNIDSHDFERILELFDYDNAKMFAITRRTYSTWPLPSGYWQMTDPNYWKHFTQDENNTGPINPWDFTVPMDYMKAYHGTKRRLFDHLASYENNDNNK